MFVGCVIIRQLFHHGRVYFRKKAATIFKTRLSLKEKAEGLLTCPRRKNAAGGLRDVYFYSVLHNHKI